MPEEPRSPPAAVLAYFCYSSGMKWTYRILICAERCYTAAAATTNLSLFVISLAVPAARVEKERAPSREVPTGYRSLEKDGLSLLLGSLRLPFSLSYVIHARVDYISANLDGIPRRRCFRIMWKASFHPLRGAVIFANGLTN